MDNNVDNGMDSDDDEGNNLHGMDCNSDDDMDIRIHLGFSPFPSLLFIST